MQLIDSAGSMTADQMSLLPDLAAVLAPGDMGRGLPNALYTDLDLWELERERIFARGWVAVGFGKDVAQSGDARPIDLMGLPLFMLRDQGGEIRVFHNVCSHRGMTLVDKPMTLRSVIRCPYHSWCYGHDGTLRSTPHVGGPGVGEHPALDRVALGLRAVRTAIWCDIVFVDLSGKASEFEDVVMPLAHRWDDVDFSALHHGGADMSIRLEVGCNWKLAVENYCESYHLPWVHPGLNSYSRLEDHYNIVEPGRFAGQGTHVYKPRLAEDGGRFPVFADLPERWDSAAEYVALFPNLLLGVHKDHLFTIRLEPVAVDRTIEHIEFYFADSSALDDTHAELRRQLRAAWREVFEEDVSVVEGMQCGRASPAFTGGVFSPVMDEAPRSFHRWVASRLIDGYTADR